MRGGGHVLKGRTRHWRRGPRGGHHPNRHPPLRQRLQPRSSMPCSTVSTARRSMNPSSFSATSPRAQPFKLPQAGTEIGRAHVCTPVNNAHLVCRLLPEKKTQQQHNISYTHRPVTHHSIDHKL